MNKSNGSYWFHPDHQLIGFLFCFDASWQTHREIWFEMQVPISDETEDFSLPNEWWKARKELREYGWTEVENL